MIVSDRPLYTRWGKNLDQEHVLQEYPRPQFRRDSYLNLNGLWSYAIVKEEECPDRFDGEILVPFLRNHRSQASAVSCCRMNISSTAGHSSCPRTLTAGVCCCILMPWIRRRGWRSMDSWPARMWADIFPLPSILQMLCGMAKIA